MPQMMPMLWLFTLISTISLLLFIIMFIHFIDYPTLFNDTKSINKPKWIWKW